MSQEIWVAIYGVLYVATLLIGKGINLRNIIKNGNKIKAEFDIELAKPTAELKNVTAELVKVKAVNTIIVKELIDMYQARLEITNDTTEQAALLEKIDLLAELL